MVSLAKRTVNSAFWQVFSGAFQTVVRLGASIFLARALEPRDFGLFGMAWLFKEFIFYLSNLGIGSAIIAKKDIDQIDLSTCFWSMAVFRIFMFFLAFFLSPVVALFFKEPALVPIVKAISFTFLFSIFSCVSNSLLVKDLRFKTLSIVRFSGVVIESFLAVIFSVFLSLGYWSLVYALLVSSLFVELSIFYLASWRPSFLFDFSRFKYFLKYGLNALGFSFSNYLQENFDYILVGRLLGASNLGFYEFAYRIPHLVFLRISRPISAVIFPALAKCQSDADMLKGFLKSVQYLSLLVVPILSALAVSAPHLVPLLWGEKWNVIIYPLQILCISSAVKSVFSSSYSLFYCKNRPDIPFRFSLFQVAASLVFIVVGAKISGLVGVSWAMVFSSFLLFLLVIYSSYFLGFSLFSLFSSMLPSVFLGLFFSISYVFLYFICSLFSLPLLFSFLFSLISSFVILFLLFWFGFSSLRLEILSLVR